LVVSLQNKGKSSNRGAGATGAAGATALVAQTVRGQHGGNRLPFLSNCSSKFVRQYSQELEFLTIYIRLLILFCALSMVQRIKLFKINVEVCRPIIATSNRVSSIYSKFLTNIAAQKNDDWDAKDERVILFALK
jgi:hypothetical protein